MRVGVSRMGGECGAGLHGCARGCSFMDGFMVVRTLFAQQCALRSLAHHVGGFAEGWRRARCGVSLIDGMFESVPILISQSKEAVAGETMAGRSVTRMRSLQE